MHPKQKSVVVSLRVKPIDKTLLGRLFRARPAEFFRAALKVATSNDYIKNKILSELKKGA